MNENETIDRAAQEQEDHESLAESTVDRQIFAEIKLMDQPKITDFTTVVGKWMNPGGEMSPEFHLKVKLDDRWVRVGSFSTRQEAETAELAISQILVDYRAKRNAWEIELANANR